jgi:hypothetical protein
MPHGQDAKVRAPALDGVLLFVVSAALLLWFQPRTLWGPDAAALFQMVQQGVDAHWMHLLWVPIARTVARAGEAVGLDAVGAVAAASALGVAAGIALLHRAAARLGGSRREALTTALLAGTAPAVVFFGLVLEIQGVFFAFLAIAWIAATRLVAAPGASRVAQLGLTTGLAAMAHSSGHLLPVVLAAFVISRLPRDALSARRLLGWGLIGSLAHAVPPVVLELTVHLPALENLRRSFGLASSKVVEGGVPVLDLLWNDWLLAFAPIALTTWLALRDREWRATVIWLAGPLVLYLFVAWRVLSTSWTIQATEHGAYLLPFAFPFAWLTVRALGAGRALWLVAVAVILAVVTVRGELVDSTTAADPKAVVAAVDDPRGVVILADPKTADAVLLEAPRMIALRLDQLLETPRSMLREPALFDTQFATMRREGRTVAFEADVLAAISAVDLPLAPHLERTYRLERRTAGSFAAVVVLERD